MTRGPRTPPPTRSAVLGDPRDEAAHQREIVALLRTLGFSVYQLSQGYRKAKGGTRQTPGLPDLYAMHPVKRLTLWVEVKPPKEAARLARLLARPSVPPSAVPDWKRAKAQASFRRTCLASGQPYAYGTLPDVLAVLRPHGFRVGDLR